jgi:hypothetical protein
MRVFRVYQGIPGFVRLYKYSVIMTEKITDKAKWRVKVLNFFEKYGLRATEEAFGVKKSSIYKWRKLLGDNGGRVEVLCDRSRAPGRRRKTVYDNRVVSFIRGIRDKYPRMGKTKIKVFLDEYCHGQGIRAVSESTIGRIIKSHRLFSHPKEDKPFWQDKDNKVQEEVKKAWV